MATSITKHKKKIRRLGVLTSGGDSPGMNAAIRSVVRSSIFFGVEVHAIYYGYRGLLENNFSPMKLSSVANIIQRGGTIIKTNRCQEFFKKSARTKAAENLKKAKIDGLIVIGGDGTLKGAHKLWLENSIPIIGVPGTIDNDIYGTDISIGFDTAANTGCRAIDQIRDTANSHENIFLVEVMGRNTGFLAIDVGLSGGATIIVIPEIPFSLAKIANAIKKGLKRNKGSSIIVLAEGEKPGKSFQIAEKLEKKYSYKSKICILGHVQRGGIPSNRDRKIASILGAFAVQELLGGKTDALAGILHHQATLTPLKLVCVKKKHLQDGMTKLIEVLAT